jgi:signal transduction histidine kinase
VTDLRPWVDPGLGLVAAAALITESVIQGHGEGPLPVAVSVGVGLCTWRRRAWPLSTLALTLALLLLALPTLHTTHTALGVVMLAAGTVAAEGRRHVTLALATALVPTVALAWVMAGGDGDGDGQEFFTYLALTLAAVAVGDALRSRREAAAVRTQRERAAREAAARSLFDDYRLQLGRELHDSLGHALVAITTRAGVAAHLHSGEAHPELLAALSDVKQVSAEALDELRQTLRAVRGESAASPTSPGSSTEAALKALVEPLRQVGLTVDLRGANVEEPVPATVSHAGFRIVQESLTNILRHGDTDAAIVSLAVQSEQLVIEVLNDGPVIQAGPAGEQPAGQGLIGMMERAREVGGTVHAGPRAHGGWSVRAQLPLGAT